MYGFNNMKNNLPEGDDKDKKRDQGYGNSAQSQNQGYGNTQGQANSTQNQNQGYGNSAQNQNQGYGNSAQNQNQGYGNSAQSQKQGYGNTQGQANPAQSQGYGNSAQNQGYSNTQGHGNSAQNQGHGNSSQPPAYGNAQGQRQGSSQVNQGSLPDQRQNKPNPNGPQASAYGNRNQDFSKHGGNSSNCPYAQISQPRDGVIVNCQKIALKHHFTNKYLAVGTNLLSNESNQQLAFCKDNRDDECWWLVVPVNGDRTPEGDPLTYGTQIRLYNVKYGTYLHSHANYKSPVTQQSEVTSFGSSSSSDTNDHWIAERFSDRAHTQPWSSNYHVVFKHTNTGNFLHSHDEKTQNGTNEVTGYRESEDQNNIWVMEF
ncbi:hypothetical protein BB561_005746 [Smittium simulii]|uniref:MIR domain-containing protein n=1 Tax=Smittium simulii TaxID=133385 RepID=A0A2T9Y8M3_9FUNG|nr:hypothetical protein BB561_005746 [Smittium simulii]